MITLNFMLLQLFLYGVIGYFVTKLIMKRSEKARKVFSGEEPYKKLFAKA